MYGLRSINNMFAEHAGSRSDFIIVGHPEYTHGKIRSETRGMGQSWDTKQAKHPPRCLAASRSHGKLVSELTCPEPWVPLKEKTLRRQASLTQQDPASSSSPGGTLQRSSSAVGLHRDFNAFLEHLHEPQGEHVSGRTARTPLSFAKNKRHSTVCRHFAARHTELDDIKKELEASPDKTQRKLRETGAWKYYALQMEQDARLRAQFQRDVQRLAPAVRKGHDIPDVALGRTV